MGRILGLIVAVLGAAALISLALSIEGSTLIEFNGKQMDPPTSAFLIALIVIAVLLIFGTTIFGWLARLPGRVRGARVERQRQRGMTALTRGLEAVAAGDASDAQHHARLANKNLDQPALTRLLTAQAAQLAGDDETARGSYAAMLEAPETEFLGLRGLYLQAMARGDKAEAKAYADRAFRLRPGAVWAFDSVYALSVDQGQWGDALEALRLAQKQGAEIGEGAGRKSAVLLTARAYAARDASDDAAAREDAIDAIKRDAGLTPAAVLAARLEADAGKKNRAAKILEAAWEKAPHPALAKAMSDIFADAAPTRRIARLRKLAERNPDHPESDLLAAEQFIAAGQPAEAKARLEPLLLRQPNARVFTAMAEATEAADGKDAAEPWLARAADAPRDTMPGARGNFDLTTEGWQRLVREYGDHGRLAPPPLEITDTSLTRDELLALTAPATASMAEDEAADEADTGAHAAADDLPTDDNRSAADEDAPPVAAPVKPEAPVITKADGEVGTAPAPVSEPKRRRRFGFRTAEADAQAEIDAAVGPEMTTEAMTPATAQAEPVDIAEAASGDAAPKEAAKA